MLIIIGLFTPVQAEASILSVVTRLFANETAQVGPQSETNSQKMPLLEAPHNSNVEAASLVSAKTPTTKASPTLLSTAPIAPITLASSPANTNPTPKSNAITTYKVKTGDTISGIAESFDISVNTILWANGLKKTSTISVGKSLIILPISGIQHKVVSGDTLNSIALKYKADLEEITAFNYIDKTDPISIGDVIIIPDGEPTTAAPVQAPVAKAKAAITKVATAAVGASLASADGGYYIRPISGGVKTQGIHGDNGVDLADSCGTPIYASAAGTVTVSKGTGSWDGGYGNYIVISHSNGSQTLYAHMQNVNAGEGTQVSQGDVIGTIGATGKVHGVTGCHVHFEIRSGVRNPF